MNYQLNISLSLHASDKFSPRSYEFDETAKATVHLPISGSTRHDVIGHLIETLDGLVLSAGYTWPVPVEYASRVRGNIPAEDIPALTIAEDEADHIEPYPWDEMKDAIRTGVPAVDRAAADMQRAMTDEPAAPEAGPGTFSEGVVSVPPTHGHPLAPGDYAERSPTMVNPRPVPPPYDPALIDTLGEKVAADELPF